MKTKTTISKELAKIIRQIYLINKKTLLAAFFNYSGHTDQIDLYITASKENYNHRIYEVRTFYLSGDKKKTIKVLIKLNKKLIEVREAKAIDLLK